MNESLKLKYDRQTDRYIDRQICGQGGEGWEREKRDLYPWSSTAADRNNFVLEAGRVMQMIAFFCSCKFLRENTFKLLSAASKTKLFPILFCHSWLVICPLR
eukprot:GHVU01155718.1.p3 GENE.GHVU01155718.1~~GHVU01155718.1.p3  ORF type:complete len:102 (-),score=5.84 GHVU01155718.1:990-1295(-)